MLNPIPAMYNVVRQQNYDSSFAADKSVGEIVLVALTILGITILLLSVAAIGSTLLDYWIKK